MESLVDKYLNMETLDLLQIQTVAYLTGLSLENIINEMELGNFLITQVENGKWIFLSEDKVGTEITFEEFNKFLTLKILRGSKGSFNSTSEMKPKWHIAEMMPSETRTKIAFTISPEVSKQWHEFKSQLDELRPVDQLDAIHQAIALGLEHDMKTIEEMDDRIHILIMERGFGKVNLQQRDGFLKAISKLNGFTPPGFYLDEPIQKTKCSELTPEQLEFMGCAGSEGYDAGLALRDAMIEFAKNCNGIGVASHEHVDSVQRASEMMNILAKREPVEKLPGKHLSPKEYGLSLKRNQKRYG